MDPIKLPRPASLTLIALLALPCSLALAEDTPAAGTIRPVRVERSAISIDFPGGPFSKLVASLNKEELSIIQSAGLDPALPAFSVREVRVDAVIAALGRLLEPQGYMLAPVGPNLAVLSKDDRMKPQQAFGSFQLEGKIGARPGLTAEDIVAAIQQGCEFANEGKASTLRFKFHPGTKLLFVAGTQQEVDVAYRVFGTLPDTTRSLPPEKISPDKK